MNPQFLCKLLSLRGDEHVQSNFLPKRYDPDFLSLKDRVCDIYSGRNSRTCFEIENHLVAHRMKVVLKPQRKKIPTRRRSTPSRSNSFYKEGLISFGSDQVIFKVYCTQLHIHLCVFRSLLLWIRTLSRCTIKIPYLTAQIQPVACKNHRTMVDTRLTNCDGSPWTIWFVSCRNIYHFSWYISRAAEWLVDYFVLVLRSLGVQIRPKTPVVGGTRMLGQWMRKKQKQAQSHAGGVCRLIP